MFLTQKIIFDSFLLIFCMMLEIYFTFSSIISFLYLILKEKEFEIFYLVSTFVYFILFGLIIFIEDLKTYMNSDEFYYFIYYIYSFLLCFLLKKNIEQRNPHIDISKTHKFDIYQYLFLLIFFLYGFYYIQQIFIKIIICFMYMFLLSYLLLYVKILFI